MSTALKAYPYAFIGAALAVSIGSALFEAPDGAGVLLPIWAWILLWLEYSREFERRRLPWSAHLLAVGWRKVRLPRRFDPQPGDKVCDCNYRHQRITMRFGDELILEDGTRCSLAHCCEPAGHKWSHPR